MVVRGFLREYFVMSDGTERTKAFVRAGESTGSLADLLSKRPSRAFIVAEEPSRVFVADYAQLRALAEIKPRWALWTLRMVEGMFLWKAEREYELLGLDAKARYEAFAARYPGLESRIAARHVASYLGITPVHLSRLRRRRREQRVLNLG
jgi:CRP-like cAMP-binding protein